MRWQNLRRSSNIEDRRGIPGGIIGGGGGLIAVGVIVALLGGDPTPFLMEGINRTIQTRTQTSPIPKAEQDEMFHFSAAILASTEETWHDAFQKLGGQYTDPHMVVFSGMTRSACGQAVQAMGPFYCPFDETIYLDLEFFQELRTRHDAPGDFAQAYIIAHEVGHHVQNQLGVLDQVQAAKARNPHQANAISVKTELMADCLAGIWAHETQERALLENGDLEEALRAASHIGDDTLQKQQRGYIVPDSFTHGTSAQRYAWFKKGFEAGDIKACNSFE
ncbi:MAG TPA: neutral zinc metallopeptidase [Alphaproteobacteria bacterium]